MSIVKLNVNRTQIIDVPVPVENGEFHVFKAEMKILKSDDDKDKKVLDLLVSVENIELTDENGQILSPSATVEAIKNDAQLATLVTNAWTLGNQNIAEKQKTLLQPQNV